MGGSVRPSRIFWALLVLAALFALAYKSGQFKGVKEIDREGCQKAVGKRGPGAMRACLRARRINHDAI